VGDFMKGTDMGVRYESFCPVSKEKGRRIVERILIKSVTGEI
jgi:hypothetical protein